MDTQRKVLFLALCAAVELLLPGSSRAAGLVGDGTSASCTEVEFVAAVEGGGEINFNCGSNVVTVSLTTEQHIKQPTTIVGADRIVLSGNSATRLFNVEAGASLELRSIVLEKGANTSGQGGAILNQGELIMKGATIRNSTTIDAYSGGAVYTLGPVQIDDSLFLSNTSGAGGALYVASAAAAITIRNSQMVGNKAIRAAGGDGGAMFVEPSVRLDMVDSYLTENTAMRGGAVFVSANVIANLSSSAVGSAIPNKMRLVRNKASRGGGALFNAAGNVTLLNVDLTENEVPFLQPSLECAPGELIPGAFCSGGAISSSGVLKLSNSNIQGNRAAYGGGVYHWVGDVPSYDSVHLTAFKQNVAQYDGGGFYVEGGPGLVEIYTSGFSNNTAGAQGGGLMRIATNISINDSSFTQNSADEAGGLMLFMPAGAEPTTYAKLQNVTISGNKATGTGAAKPGGLSAVGPVEVSSATIANNIGGGVSFARQQGVIVDPAPSTLSAAGSDVSLSLKNTVLQNSGYANCYSLDNRPLIDSGHNFATDLSCGFTLSEQGADLDAKLNGLLEDPSGVASHQEPVYCSPLIERGGDCPTTDQVGLARGATCDIGAVERTPGMTPDGCPFLPGRWTAQGVAGPFIDVTERAVTIYLSYAGRPPGVGVTLDASTISVDFPDDQRYEGKLEQPNQIRWSNGTVWTRTH